MKISALLSSVLLIVTTQVFAEEPLEECQASYDKYLEQNKATEDLVKNSAFVPKSVLDHNREATKNRLKAYNKCQTTPQVASLLKDIEAQEIQLILLNKDLENVDRYSQANQRVLNSISQVNKSYQQLLSTYDLSLQQLDIYQNWLAPYTSGTSPNADANVSTSTLIASITSIDLTREELEAVNQELEALNPNKTLIAVPEGDENIQALISASHTQLSAFSNLATELNDKGLYNTDSFYTEFNNQSSSTVKAFQKISLWIDNQTQLLVQQSLLENKNARSQLDNVKGTFNVQSTSEPSTSIEAPQLEMQLQSLIDNQSNLSLTFSELEKLELADSQNADSGKAYKEEVSRLENKQMEIAAEIDSVNAEKSETTGQIQQLEATFK